MQAITSLSFANGFKTLKYFSKLQQFSPKWTTRLVGANGRCMYNFNTEQYSQLILFQNCEATNGRHNFISNGKSSASGIVFHKCKSKGLGSNSGDTSESEGHRLWTQAMLFDSIDENSPDTGHIGLINRGNYGSGHGWAAAHSTIWNYNGTITVQKPPTAQNYAVSSTGKVQKKFKFSGVIGNVEGEGEKGQLSPASLYEAQLKQRLQQRAIANPF